MHREAVMMELSGGTALRLVVSLRDGNISLFTRFHVGRNHIQPSIYRPVRSTIILSIAKGQSYRRSWKEDTKTTQNRAP